MPFGWQLCVVIPSELRYTLCARYRWCCDKSGGPISGANSWCLRKELGMSGVSNLDDFHAMSSSTAVTMEH